MSRDEVRGEHPSAPADVDEQVIEDLESLAEFEREHRRLLAMQALYQRRSRRSAG